MQIITIALLTTLATLAPAQAALHIKPPRGALLVQNMDFLCRRPDAAGRQILPHAVAALSEPSRATASLAGQIEQLEAELRGDARSGNGGV